MDTVRRPLCGCFVLSCMVGGIFRKPLGFRRCLPPARPEKAWPFQAGRSPCTKHRQIVRLRLHALKKVFEGSKGRFFKNAPLAGCGTASHKRRESQPSGHAFSGGTKSFHETPTDCPAWPLRPKKVFEGSKERFFKNAPWQGVGRSPTESEKACPTGHAFSGRTKSFHETPQIVRLGFYAPKKFLGVPRGVFSKTLLGRAWDRIPQRENSSLFGRVRLFRRDKVLSRNIDRPSGLAFTHRKSF